MGIGIAQAGEGMASGFPHADASAGAHHDHEKRSDPISFGVGASYEMDGNWLRGPVTEHNLVDRNEKKLTRAQFFTEKVKEVLENVLLPDSLCDGRWNWWRCEIERKQKTEKETGTQANTGWW
jgi:hypothetical protein